jgi:hypothetical protein
MLTRVYRAVAAAAACLLAAVGCVVLAVVSPIAFVGVIAVGLIVGLVVATHLPEVAGEFPATSRPQRDAADIGAIAAAVTLAALLALAGSAAVLGAAAAPVLLLLFLALGAGLWRHRAAWWAYAIAVARAETPSPPGAMTVRALCLAWQRTHSSLHGLPTGPARAELISTRERLLDELEQRDPVGFRHWLHRGVHASSDPGHYLTENRTGRSTR